MWHHDLLFDWLHSVLCAFMIVWTCVMLARGVWPMLFGHVSFGRAVFDMCCSSLPLWFAAIWW